MSYSIISRAIPPGRLAERLGVSPGAISNWKTRGIPADRVIDVARATDWKITPHELRPDLYPDPDDGMPRDRRVRAA